MKKRIRLHQLRIGMFVEELESADGPSGKTRAPFLVRTATDVEHVLSSRAMSVVINIRKGSDSGVQVASRPVPTRQISRAQFEAQLESRFSRREIQAARKSVASTVPHIRNLMGEARMNGVFAVDCANDAVEQIMAGAVENAGALIGLLRLKKADEATFLHSLAVSALMIAFGRRLGMAEGEVKLLGLGGLVHDLGKMKVPKALLVKTGKLTAAETEAMREHPRKGHALLSVIPDLPEEVLAICLHHHERYDGTGYPDGLAGETIPYVARVAAICDVYEAMTTIRPYKKAWSQADTIDMMLKSHGHFDVDLLNAFVTGLIVPGVIR